MGVFLSVKIRSFSAVASTSLKLIQRDLSFCWLFTSTFPTSVTDGTPRISSPPIAASGWLLKKLCLALRCGQVPGQVELYCLSSCGVLGHRPVAFHGEELASLRVLMNWCGFF